MPEIRQLKDGRWQVMREDGASIALTREQWLVLLVLLKEQEDAN